MTHTKPEIIVRIVGGIHDRDKPGCQPDPDHASRCSYLATARYSVSDEGTPTPHLAVVDHGPKIGRKVYHLPTDGAPGLALPAADRDGRRVPGLLEYSTTGFRTLRDAKTFMLAVHASGTLPTDRAATRDEVGVFGKWLETYLSTA